MIDYVLLGIGATFLFAFHAARGIYPGDAGDLVTAATTMGIPHAPGYPLYTLLGFLATRIPLLSPAWRMAWVSILPHVGAILLVYWLTRTLTKSRISALFSASILIGNYLFFLYSTTPEVFALLDFFVIGLFSLSVYLLVKNYKKNILFSVLGLGIGLSLSHHPLIVLLFPSLFILLLPVLRPVRVIIHLLGGVMVGLLPYLYIFIAAHGSSMINWDRPTTLARFIRLLSRADYGTFMSGTTIGHTMIERLLNVQAYMVFMLVDFSWIGIVLALYGLVILWRRQKTIAQAYVLAFVLLGPAFSFYSSFPIVNRFILGTVERFALPSYVLLVPLVGLGFAACYQRIRRYRTSVALLFALVMFLYPLTMGYMTLWRFSGLSQDFTTDNYAKDVLDSAPKKAILILSRDTPLFDVQYVRYALGYRTDVIVLHRSRMPFPDYQEVIVKNFPDIIIPHDANPETFVDSFIRENAKRYVISSNITLPMGTDWVWVPHGLVYVLYPKQTVPNRTMVFDDNQTMWKSFHDPKKGLLSRYNHLFLTNVLDEYAISSIEYGKYLLRSERFEEAIAQFDRSVRYDSDTQTPTAWMYKGVAESFAKKCDAALASYTMAKIHDVATNSAVLYFEAVTYRDCLGDASRSAMLFSQLQNMDRQFEQPLEGPQ